jgi:hypothetical protein
MTADWISHLCSSVDAGTMMHHLEEFAKRVKLSGTDEELESLRYLQCTLHGYGYRTGLILHDAYISLPGKAWLEVEAASLDCITHSFSRSSPAGGLRASVVYGGNGQAEDFAAIDARGRIVLLEGMANPSASRNASLAGAVGQIHISPHEHLHEMCISPVWGSPTQATRDAIPSTVVLTLRKSDGDALKRVLGNAAIEASLHAEVDTRWRKIPILVADLPGPDAEEPFVMFSGHHDTWYYGVMDNGGANATMLEVARIFAPERAAWRRGLRLCFWSGHSHGRYAGSTWYADTHWHELARRCVAHVNVDSTGAKGNTVLSDAPCSAELCKLAREAIGVRGRQEFDGHRMSRAGDQSFWGIGVPSMFMGMGEQPAGSSDSFTRSIFGGGVARKGAGFGWWWHTPDDTLDKMDSDLLVRDTQIYVHAIARLLTDHVLPLDYAAAATELRQELTKTQQALADAFDLSPLITRADLLREKSETLAGKAVAGDAAVARVNEALVAVSRAMVPMDYTLGDRFDHDPALPQSRYPALDVVRQLATAPRDSDQAPFLRGGAQRASNRLGFALDQAIDALTSCLQAI